MNKEEIKKELGVPSKLNFESCNMKVNQDFQFTGVCND
jgi:cathepsin A (carboxypeptidase C)